jgi:hypothetical protein
MEVLENMIKKQISRIETEENVELVEMIHAIIR